MERAVVDGSYYMAVGKRSDQGGDPGRSKLVANVISAISLLGSVVTIVESRNSLLWIASSIVVAVFVVAVWAYKLRIGFQVVLLIVSIIVACASFGWISIAEVIYGFKDDALSRDMSGTVVSAVKTDSPVVPSVSTVTRKGSDLSHGPSGSSRSASNVRKNVILVPPFENLTGYTSEIKVERSGDIESFSKKIQVTTDRYSESPRTILEDILVSIPNVSVVERQQLDKLLLESEYTRSSGIVDAKFALEIGRQLGANAVMIGTIVNLNEEKSTFSGYGIKTDRVAVVATVRIRLIDIKSSAIIYSETIKGQSDSMVTNYGGVKPNDLAFLAIDRAINSLKDNTRFIEKISGTL